MFVVLVTDVYTNRFDFHVYGPFETEGAAKAAMQLMPVVRTRTRKVLMVRDPKWMGTLADNTVREG